MKSLEEKEINDWDFVNFDKPKNYHIYMPRNNISGITIIEIGINLANAQSKEPS